MNRATRRTTSRARERSARNDLRQRGCTCTPTLAPEPAPAGMSWGFDVRHRLGCPLGDLMLPANAPG